jgi:hypothetical protein
LLPFAFLKTEWALVTRVAGLGEDLLANFILLEGYYFPDHMLPLIND